VTAEGAGGDRASPPPTDEARLAAQGLKEAAGGGLGQDVALARLEEASTALVAGVDRALPPWSARAAETLLSAWGGVDADRRREVVAAAREAGERAARRVAALLGELFALDPAEQRATPLEIIRTAVVEPTAVLAEAGMPDVVRDPFEERAWPEDRFGLVPRTLRDLDPDLAAVHFAWGVAKAAVLRARAAGPPP
jgi:dihydrodipicolinate synthase/N-acetylneuraminate lyase